MVDVHKVTTSVLVLGCGRMGSRISCVLASRGVSVSAWNRTSTAMEALVPFGVTPAPDLATALRNSPLVVAVLSTYSALFSLIDSLPEEAWKDVVLLNLCSGSAREAVLMAEFAARLGLHYADGSIWTYPEQIGGSDTVLAYAGPTNVRRTVSAVVNLLGGGSIDLGEDIQTPNVMEAAFAGSFYMVTYAAAAESVRLAQAYNIDIENMEVALEAAMKLVGEGLHDLLTRKKTARYEADGITVEIALNALESYQQTASDRAVPMPLVSKLKEQYISLSQEGFKGSDLSVLAKVR